MTHADYKLKIVAIICFAFIAISSFIAYTNPANGYELSIYESTPFIVWIFLIISIAGGVTIIVHQAYTKRYKNSNFWLIGFLILILSRITLLYIPFIRGYYAWMGDVMTHIGYAKDILLTGHIGSNTYPVTHILVVEVTAITKIPLIVVADYIPALFSVFYVISVYLLSTVVLQRREAQLLSAAAAAGVLLFGGMNTGMMAFGFSLLYFPLVFFFYFKVISNFNRVRYNLLLVIVVILYPFFHQTSSLVLWILLLTIGFIRVLLVWGEHKKISLNHILHLVPFTLVILGVIISIYWSFLLTSRYHRNIQNILATWANTMQSQRAITVMSSKLEKINVHGIELVELIIKTVGADLIFLTFSIITAIILLKNYKERKSNNNLIILLGITFVAGIMYSTYLFNIVPGLKSFCIERLRHILVLFTPIFVGYSYQHFLSKRRTYITALACIVLIMTASTISIFGVYYSPYIMRPSNQVTQADMDEMTWSLNYKSREVMDITISSPTWRFADVISGTIACHKRNDIQPRHQGCLKLPEHFNYAINSYLGESYNEDKYAVLRKYDKVVYDTVWRAVGRFHEEDFDKLENDQSVDKLYSNGAGDIWYIHALG